MDKLPIKATLEELNTEIKEGYISLSKWIIALSTGTIAFGVSLVKPDTSIIWKQELFFGLGLLGISILSGVRYVKLTIDYTLYNLETILNEKRLEYMRGYPAQEEQEVKGKMRKAGDIVKDFYKTIKSTEKKMDTINRDMIILSRWQQWLFYIGIILIALFGVLSIN